MSTQKQAGRQTPNLQDIFRARHDEASRIASWLEEQGHDEAARFAEGRASAWSKARSVLDGVRYSRE